MIGVLRRLPPFSVRRAWLPIVLNLGSFAALWLMSSQLFVSGTDLSRPQASATISPALLASWLLAAVATFISALQLAVPLGQLSRDKRAIGAVAVGLAVGAVAALAGGLSSHLWGLLGPSTMNAAGWLLQLVYDDTFVDTDSRLMGTGRFFVKIAAVCSGFESMGLVVVLMGAYLITFASRFRFPHALLLVPLGLVLAWSVNTVRIAALIGLGTSYSPQTALGAFHSKAGWVLFCVVTIATAAVGRHRLFSTQDTAPEAQPHETHGQQEHATQPASAACLVPMLVLLAASLVTGALWEPLDRAYALRIVLAAGALYWFRSQYPLGMWRVHWLPLLAGVLVAGLWLITLPPVPEATLQLFDQQLSNLSDFERWVWLGTRTIGTSLVVPIVEELAFRSYLLRRLVSSDFQEVPLNRLHWVALCVSSIAFGLLHGNWIGGTISGVVFALLQVWRGRTGDAIAAHVVANAALSAAALGANRWELWL